MVKPEFEIMKQNHLLKKVEPEVSGMKYNINNLKLKLLPKIEGVKADPKNNHNNLSKAIEKNKFLIRITE